MKDIEILDSIIKSFDIGFLTGICVASFAVLNIILIFKIDEWSEKRKEKKKMIEEKEDKREMKIKKDLIFKKVISQFPYKENKLSQGDKYKIYDYAEKFEIFFDYCKEQRIWPCNVLKGINSSHFIVQTIEKNPRYLVDEHKERFNELFDIIIEEDNKRCFGVVDKLKNELKKGE